MRIIESTASFGRPLCLTNILIQLFVIRTLFSQDAFTLMLKLTSVMTLIPYLLVAAASDR